MSKAITLPDSITFSDYFKLNYYPADILAVFGYSFHSQELTLPTTTRQLEGIDLLRQRLRRNLPHITLDSETARREFLIAPVLMDLLDYTQADLKVLYSLTVSDRLRGELDYYIEAKHQLLVIEAKDENLQRGSKQLAVELVALDQWTDATHPVLYGAVSIGNIWQFSVLDRSQKRVTQDLNIYSVPKEVDQVMSILVGILEGDTLL